MIWHMENKKLEMKQRYPMEMNLGVLRDIQENSCVFDVEFSRNDFMGQKPLWMPASCFMELLGQAAEYLMRSTQGDCKRYLVQVNEFTLDPEFYQVMDQNFTLRVELTQTFGNLNKSRASLSHGERSYCEGSFMHSDIT